MILFVEGDGDKSAVPTLARKALKQLVANDVLVVDDEPFRVDGVGKLVKNDCANWHRWLRAALGRKNVACVLLVLDGDLSRVPPSWKRYVQHYKTDEFCAYRVAALLADEARKARAGEAFSVAIVFVMREFEAWLVAGIESLRGAMLAEGRAVIRDDATFPIIDIEARRDAKGELRKLFRNTVNASTRGFSLRASILSLSPSDRNPFNASGALSRRWWMLCVKEVQP